MHREEERHHGTQGFLSDQPGRHDVQGGLSTSKLPDANTESNPKDGVHNAERNTVSSHDERLQADQSGRWASLVSTKPGHGSREEILTILGALHQVTFASIQDQFGLGSVLLERGMPDDRVCNRKRGPVMIAKEQKQGSAYGVDLGKS